MKTFTMKRDAMAARSVRRTVAAITAPCSVNIQGGFRRQPKREIISESVRIALDLLVQATRLHTKQPGDILIHDRWHAAYHKDVRTVAALENRNNPVGHHQLPLLDIAICDVRRRIPTMLA